MSINLVEDIVLVGNHRPIVSSPDGTAVNPLRSYKFESIFPTAVSDIALSYDSSDTIEEFTVEFAVQNIAIGVGGENSDVSDQAGIRIA